MTNKIDVNLEPDEALHAIISLQNTIADSYARLRNAPTGSPEVASTMMRIKVLENAQRKIERGLLRVCHGKTPTDPLHP